MGCVGVLSTGLAVVSGFGMLLLLGCPFVMTVASCPFMILGMVLVDIGQHILQNHLTNVSIIQ